MSTTRICLLVGFDIHDGKFSEFEDIAKQMVAVSDKEPGTLIYNFVLSTDRKHCQVLEGYTDTAAITAQFRGPAVQQFTPQLLKVASPTIMEFYGDPGPEVIANAAPCNPSVSAPSLALIVDVQALLDDLGEIKKSGWNSHYRDVAFRVESRRLVPRSNVRSSSR